jgi:uncharacterized protein YecT (DUF1311 family)
MGTFGVRFSLAAGVFVWSVSATAQVPPSREQQRFNEPVAPRAQSAVRAEPTIAPVAQKPSFDCSKARSGAARLICSDPPLIEADRQLGDAFQKAIANLSGEEKQGQIRTQVNWIRERNVRCGLENKTDVPVEQLTSAKPCLHEAMNKRMGELVGAGAHSPRTGPSPSGGNQSIALSASEIADLRKAITENWRANGFKGEIVIELKLDRQGKLTDSPRIQGNSSDPGYPEAVENVRRAVVAAQPFKMLRAASYDSWKHIEIAFAPGAKARPSLNGKELDSIAEGSKSVTANIESWFAETRFNLSNCAYQSHIEGFLKPEHADVFLDDPQLKMVASYLWRKIVTLCDRQIAANGAPSNVVKSDDVGVDLRLASQDGRVSSLTTFMSSRDNINWRIDNPIRRTILGIKQEQQQATANAQRALAEDNQRLQAIEAGRQAAVKMISDGTLPVAKSGDDFNIVAQVIGAMGSRSLSIAMSRLDCSGLEYLGGAIVGRSVEGTIGVFLVDLVLLNKDRAVLRSDSSYGNLCGRPNRPLSSGEYGQVQIKAQFRKYDTGWRFEQII